jgi:hypothetical protein
MDGAVERRTHLGRAVEEGHAVLGRREDEAVDVGDEIVDPQSRVRRRVGRIDRLDADPVGGGREDQPRVEVAVEAHHDPAV